MTFREQFALQREHARFLRDSMGAHGLTLVAVKYRGKPARVSIIGNAITYAALDVWRARGARIYILERL